MNSACPVATAGGPAAPWHNAPPHAADRCRCLQRPPNRPDPVLPCVCSQLRAAQLDQRAQGRRMPAGRAEQLSPCSSPPACKAPSGRTSRRWRPDGGGCSDAIILDLTPRRGLRWPGLAIHPTAPISSGRSLSKLAARAARQLGHQDLKRSLPSIAGGLFSAPPGGGGAPRHALPHCGAGRAFEERRTDRYQCHGCTIERPGNCTLSPLSRRRAGSAGWRDRPNRPRPDNRGCCGRGAGASRRGVPDWRDPAKRPAPRGFWRCHR